MSLSTRLVEAHLFRVGAYSERGGNTRWHLICPTDARSFEVTCVHVSRIYPDTVLWGAQLSGAWSTQLQRLHDGKAMRNSASVFHIPVPTELGVLKVSRTVECEQSYAKLRTSIFNFLYMYGYFPHSLGVHTVLNGSNIGPPYLGRVWGPYTLQTQSRSKWKQTDVP